MSHQTNSGLLSTKFEYVIFYQSLKNFHGLYVCLSLHLWCFIWSFIFLSVCLVIRTVCIFGVLSVFYISVCLSVCLLIRNFCIFSVFRILPFSLSVRLVIRNFCIFSVFRLLSVCVSVGLFVFFYVFRYYLWL
jgi:hypothetical protein